MNRKKFVENMSALTAAGLFSGFFLESCSTNNNGPKLQTGPSIDSLSVSKDTLPVPDSLNDNLKGIPQADTTYTDKNYPKLMDNYARARYCDIVGQNAEKMFPRCKPYLELILKSNWEHRNIYDIPPEFHIAMLKNESDFDPKALSSVAALGIAQFMRYSAIDAGLKVYDGRKYKELYDSEKRLRELSDDISVLWFNDIIPSLRKNDFKAVEKLKKKYDLVVIEHAKLKEFIRQTYMEKMPNMESEDERLDWKKEIPISAKDYARTADRCQKFFGGKHLHNVIRATAAYNCGFGNVEKWKGLPFIQETIGYVRNIMVDSDKLAPQLANSAYEGNPQIIAELVAGKIYTLNSQANFK